MGVSLTEVEYKPVRGMINDSSLLPSEDPRYANFTDYELIVQGIETFRNQRISLNRVSVTGSITDSQHRTQIQVGIQRNGQQIPIWVRARLDENDEIAYDIMDGFHREAVVRGLGEEYINAKVSFGISDERLYDERILAARSAKSVQFTRTARWMNEVFALSEWSDRGYTVTQIFSLANNKRHAKESGKGLGLSEEEAKRAYDWATTRAKQWEQKISSILTTLIIAEAAAPELVDIVHIGGGGSDGKGVMSPARLQAIAIPLRDRHDLQIRLSEIILNENIQAKPARMLAEKLAKQLNNPGDIEYIFDHWREFIKAESTTVNGGALNIDANIQTERPARTEETLDTLSQGLNGGNMVEISQADQAVLDAFEQVLAENETLKRFATPLVDIILNLAEHYKSAITFIDSLYREGRSGAYSVERELQLLEQLNTALTGYGKTLKHTLGVSKINENGIDAQNILATLRLTPVESHVLQLIQAGTSDTQISQILVLNQSDVEAVIGSVQVKIHLQEKLLGERLS